MDPTGGMLPPGVSVVDGRKSPIDWKPAEEAVDGAADVYLALKSSCNEWGSHLSLRYY